MYSFKYSDLGGINNTPFHSQNVHGEFVVIDDQRDSTRKLYMLSDYSIYDGAIPAVHVKKDGKLYCGGTTWLYGYFLGSAKAGEELMVSLDNLEYIPTGISPTPYNGRNTGKTRWGDGTEEGGDGEGKGEEVEEQGTDEPAPATEAEKEGRNPGKRKEKKADEDDDGVVEDGQTDEVLGTDPDFLLGGKKLGHHTVELSGVTLSQLRKYGHNKIASLNLHKEGDRIGMIYVEGDDVFLLQDKLDGSHPARLSRTGGAYSVTSTDGVTREIKKSWQIVGNNFDPKGSYLFSPLGKGDQKGEGKSDEKSDKQDKDAVPPKKVTIELEFDKSVRDVVEETATEKVDEFIKEGGIENYLGSTLKDAMKETMKELRPTVIKIPELDREVKIEGKVHKNFEECLVITSVEKKLFMMGPAGSGKTTIAADIAKAYGRKFAFISCSAGLSEAHLLGRMLFDGTYVESEFVNVYENGGVFLFDEIDAADPNTLLVVNSALANGHLSVPNRKEKPVAQVHEDFVCIVAGNTWGKGSFEYSGRATLDSAFLDRFSMSKSMVDYDEDLERQLGADEPEVVNMFLDLRKKIKEKDIRRIVSTRSIVSGLRMKKAGLTLDYIKNKYLLDWTKDEVAKVK